MSPPARGRRRDDGHLPARAALFLVGVAVATAAVAAEPLSELRSGTGGWVTFFVLAAAAAVAQLFAVQAPRNAARHYTTVVFLIAGVLLLPAGLVALLGVVQHVPEWVKLRYAWYIQTFNILNYTLSCLAAWWAVHLVLDPVDGLSAGGRWAAAAAVACLAFVSLNHGLLAPMMHLAGRRRIWKSELFSIESLSTDLILAALGAGFATLWLTNRWLVLAVVAPLVLIQRSLNVAGLEEEARVDAKTGLYNARHFAAEVKDELERSQRLGRPMSVIMADLDLLRDINNSYGHLAGDAVLRGVADVFRRQLRDSDVAARFGGEEFAVLLPETDGDEAMDIAERIRLTTAETPIWAESAGQAINVTMSVGVASFPTHGTDPDDLLH
ncbi:MAG TPA: GGDEF domain-containing protein, partial [Actinomycetota bacterium]|nr:GGDEF domain-containing protein [Actinomycetota bacterium]